MKNIGSRIMNRLHTIYCKIAGATIGQNCSIYMSAEISNLKHFSLGNASTIYKKCTFYLGRNGTFALGSNSHIAPFGYILAGENQLTIGDDVAIGPFCSFFCVSNSTKGKSHLFRENYVEGNITIGNNVFVGAHCVFHPGTVVKDNIAIAANSVVKGTLESGWIYGGNPAVKLKQIGS